MIDNKPSIYNAQSVYNQGGGGENIDEFLLLEYIEQKPAATESCYFKIPFDTEKNDELSLTFALSNELSNYNMLVGFNTSDSTLQYYTEVFLQRSTSGVSFVSTMNTSGYQDLGFSFTKGKKYKVTRKSGDIEVYEYENSYYLHYSKYNGGTWKDQKYIQICGDNNWPTQNTKTKIYGFTLKRNGVTLINLFPVVRRDDGVTCGLFDIVNNKVYYTLDNQSTSFTPGQIL